jgi:hypothetical protein
VYLPEEKWEATDGTRPEMIDILVTMALHASGGLAESLGGGVETIRQMAAAFTQLRCEVETTPQVETSLTVRSWSRVWDCAYRLSSRHYTNQPVSPLNGIKASVTVMLLLPLSKGGTTAEALLATAKHSFTRALSLSDPAELSAWDHDFVRAAEQRSSTRIRSDYVLDPSVMPDRYRVATSVAIAMATNMPILLEGPAACGKSSLVEYMEGARVERVNLSNGADLQVRA